MLKALDRYILKKYLSAFFFVVMILVVVICVIDYTEKNDTFIRHNLSARVIFLDYYINFFVYIANMLAPIIAFIATVFVTARLASRTEIVAILSAGVSFKRILFPYFLGAVMISSIIFYLHGFVIPRANRVRMNFENQYVWSEHHYDKRNIHIKIAPTSLIYMESYNNSITCGYQITLETIKDGKLLDKITASRLLWQPASKKWRLEFWKKHIFNGKNESATNGDILDTTINLHPEDFESQRMMHEQLTITELSYEINKLRDRGSDGVVPYEIERYDRFTYPFSIIILTIIGVIVASKKSRNGVGAQIAFGFLLAFSYVLFVVIGRSLANVGGLPPALSCWLPNFIFSSIGLIMYWRIPK